MKNKCLLCLCLFLGFSSLCKAKRSKEEKSMNKFVTNLMSKMTLEEKIGQTVLFSSTWDITGPITKNDYLEHTLDGSAGAVFNALTCDFIYRLQKKVVEGSRLGIPLIFGYDVIHGYRTTFPIPLALAASWDLNSIQRVSRLMSKEAASDGLQWTFSPMVDVARDPRWGRVAEGSGEDTFLTSEIAKAQVKGIQGDDLKSPETLLACVKHFAAYGAPVGGREYNSVDMSERQLREFYLPPYKAAIDAGCATIMASFNDINGVPATSNRWLLTDLLRKEWGFKGLVVSDYTGVYELTNHCTARDSADAGAQSLHAGLDMDMQSAIFMNYTMENYKKKLVTLKEINTACRRVLEMKYKVGLFDDPYKYTNSTRAKATLKNPSLFKEAQDIAKRCIVLLKNNQQILPLSKEISSIALIGPMVKDKQNQLGTWHTAGRQETVIPINEAFYKKFPNSQILIEEGCRFDGNDHSRFEAAVNTAKKAEVIVLCMGEQEFESGECASKTDIRLAKIQRELIAEISKLKKPMVLLLHSGRPMVITNIEPQFDAILQTWHLGSMAGPAIADVVSGDYNPSAKLTMTFPRAIGQIPIYYNYLNTGRPTPGDGFTSKYRDCSNEPLYPFGYGLSYTNFTYSPISLDTNEMTDKGVINATVSVTNSGSRDGEEVVQLYVRDMVASVSRPLKELKAFKKVFIKSGETITLTFSITNEMLKFYNSKLIRQSEPGEFTVFIGGSSKTDNLKLFTLK